MNRPSRSKGSRSGNLVRRQSLRRHFTPGRRLSLEPLEDRHLLSLAPQLVADINTLPFDASPSGFCEVGNLLYFTVNTTLNGRELWKSDGTEAGTVMVKDINEGSGSSYLGYLTNVGGTLFFQAYGTS